MLHALVSFLIVLGVSAATPRAWPSPGSGPGARPSRILGRVVDPRSRAGIGLVRVQIDERPADTVTGDDGTFEFAGVTPGSHRLVARLEGFAPSMPVKVTVTEGADAHVEIEYALGLTTEVRGTAAPEAPLPPATIGTVSLSGRQVASAAGGLDDVSRVMQLQPGVAASQDDRNDLLVRGGGAYETAVRIDGFELPTASHFAWPGSTSGGLSLIPSAVIDRATVETSGFSVAFGERASALFDVTTRVGGPSRVGARADVGAGGLLGLVEGRLPGARGAWMVSARRSILEVVFSRGDSRATPRYADLLSRLDLDLSPKHHARLLVVGLSDGLDVDWDTGSSTQQIRGDQDMVLVGFGVRSTWTEATETSLSVSFSNSQGALNETEATATSFGEQSRERVVRARAEWRRSIGSRVRLLAGLAAKRETLTFDLRDGAYRNDYGILVPAVSSIWSADVTDASGYVEASTSPLRPLRVAVGARADRSGLTASWYGSPRARLELVVTPRWRVTGTWGVYRQDIPRIWIGSNAANRALEPIRCSQATVGVAGEPRRGMTLAAEGFVKRYTGYPIDPSRPARVLISAGADFESPLVGKLVPSGLVHADGVDLSFSQRVAEGLDVAAGYSYWDVKEFNLERQWIPADYDMRHQGRVRAVWHRSPRWSASTVWRYASGRPYTPYDVAASIKANAGRYDRRQNNAASYPAYHRLDVRLERVFIVRRVAMTGFVEVDNVYNRDNVLMYDWSRSARRAQPIYQWGRTPVAGLRLEF